jgi:hypothetical protein
MKSMFNRAKSSFRVFKRKLNTFRKDPIGSFSSKIHACCKWGIEMVNPILQQRAESQLLKRRCLDFLKLRPPNALPPDFADLWFLYQTVRRRKPRVILEFGSGCSTVIFAQALWDNKRESSKCEGYLYSIDADLYWTEVTVKSMPTHLQRFCEIWYSPLLEVEFKGTFSFRYAQIPDVVPDLIYLDGPALTLERQVAVDVLDIEDRFPPDFCLIVDGRTQNTMFLRKHLKRRYVFKHRWLFSNSVFKLLN